MQKVLFVIEAGEFGGLEIVLLDWLSGIDYTKTSAIVCSRTDVLKQRLALKNLPVEIVQMAIPDGEPFWRSFPSWLQLFSSLRPEKIVLLEAVTAEFSFATILAAWWTTPGRVVLFKGGSIFRPPVSTGKRRIHYGVLPGIGLYRFQQITGQKLRARLAHHTFAASKGLKDNLQTYFGYPPKRISILYHGVDTARFKPSTAKRLEYRQAYGIPSDATVIVSHGRLVPVKRVDRILRCFEVLSGEFKNIWLLLTAYGPLKDDVEKTVRSSDAYRRVKLVNFQKDTSTMLQASDIYVLASDSEAFGISLIEAMSTGLVCVATNGQGPADILVNEENGILVGATDEDVLVGLRRALNLSREEQTQLVERARRTIENRFEIISAVARALDSMAIPRR